MYSLVTLSYGLGGVLLAFALWRSERWRESPRHHAVALALFVLGGTIVLTCGSGLGPPGGDVVERGLEYHRRVRESFLALGAGVAYLPALVYLAVFWSSRALERLLSGAGVDETPDAERSPREERALIEQCLRTLAVRPLDARTREVLAAAYRRIGELEAAVREYRKAVESVERGYTQARLLYKAVWIQVELLSDAPGAIVSLRRLVRLYPRSYFAAFARRVIRQWETGDPRRWRASDRRRPEP